MCFSPRELSQLLWALAVLNASLPRRLLEALAGVVGGGTRGSNGESSRSKSSNGGSNDDCFSMSVSASTDTNANGSSRSGGGGSGSPASLPLRAWMLRDQAVALWALAVMQAADSDAFRCLWMHACDELSHESKREMKWRKETGQGGRRAAAGSTGSTGSTGTAGSAVGSRDSSHDDGRRGEPGDAAGRERMGVKLHLLSQLHQAAVSALLLQSEEEEEEEHSRLHEEGHTPPDGTRALRERKRSPNQPSAGGNVLSGRLDGQQPLLGATWDWGRGVKAFAAESKASPSHVHREVQRILASQGLREVRGGEVRRGGLGAKEQGAGEALGRSGPAASLMGAGGTQATSQPAIVSLAAARAVDASGQAGCESPGAAAAHEGGVKEGQGGDRGSATWWVSEYSGGDTWHYSLDIALPQCKVAIEVDGPTHFMRNTRKCTAPTTPTLLERGMSGSSGSKGKGSRSSAAEEPCIPRPHATHSCRP